jgi:hypothetical protein
MEGTKPTMKMPELLVFARMFLVGLFGAEVCRAAYYLGTAFAPAVADLEVWARGCAVLVGLAICVLYAVNRGAHTAAAKMGRSIRLDLLTAVCLGAWSNELTKPWLSKLHAALKAADPHWAPIALLLLSTILVSPLVQRHWPRRRQIEPQLRFLGDEEIGREADDLLSSELQAKSFAETVLASGAHPGLVFGVDGPWGVGKTSFINLAERYWERAADMNRPGNRGGSNT